MTLRCCGVPVIETEYKYLTDTNGYFINEDWAKKITEDAISTEEQCQSSNGQNTKDTHNGSSIYLKPSVS